MVPGLPRRTSPWATAEVAALLDNLCALILFLMQAMHSPFSWRAQALQTTAISASSLGWSAIDLVPLLVHAIGVLHVGLLIFSLVPPSFLLLLLLIAMRQFDSSLASPLTALDKMRPRSRSCCCKCCRNRSSSNCSYSPARCTGSYRSFHSSRDESQGAIATVVRHPRMALVYVGTDRMPTPLEPVACHSFSGPGWPLHLSFWGPSRTPYGESWGDSRGTHNRILGAKPPIFYYISPRIPRRFPRRPPGRPPKA